MRYLFVILVCIGLVVLFPFAKRWSIIKKIDNKFNELEKVVFAKAFIFDKNKATEHRLISKMAFDSNEMATLVIRNRAPLEAVVFLGYMSIVEGCLEGDCRNYRKENDVQFSLYWMRVKEGIEDYIVQNNLPDICREEISKLNKRINDARGC